MEFRVQQRYVLTAALFIGVTIGIAERSILAMAITRMVEIPNQSDTLSSETEFICEAPEWVINTTDMIDKAQYGVKYNWTQEQQGMILSAFYVGYAATHIPGGLLAQNFGGKYVFGLGITISALCSMAIPLAVEYGVDLELEFESRHKEYCQKSEEGPSINNFVDPVMPYIFYIIINSKCGLYAIIMMRVLMGSFQGPMFPSVIQMLSIWVPLTERAFTTSLVYSGVNIGAVIASYFAGIIMHNYSWQLVFYVFGLVALVWLAIFCFICFDSPAQHPYISKVEQNYLLKELGQLRRDENQSATPWREIFSSKPVWALIIAKNCADWVYYVGSTTLPKYMNDVLHLSIRDIGTFNSLPWILKTILSFAFAFIIDRFIALGKIRITNARKLAVFLSSVLPAIFIMLASYAECEHVLVIVYFIISIGMHGFMISGLNPNTIDLSPNYSGILMSVANGAASFTGIFAPYTIGLMTPNAYLSEWRLVFWVTFAIHILTTAIFTIWGSGEIQSWNANKNTPAIKKQSADITH